MNQLDELQEIIALTAGMTIEEARKRLTAPEGSSPETGSATRAAGPDQATHKIPPQSCRSATKEGAEWTPAATLPDPDVAVIVADAEGEVGEASWDGECWVWAAGMPVRDGVAYWMHFPEPPPQSDGEEDEGAPCANCGGEDFWFSRCEPMGYFCENCGAPESDERSGSRNVKVEAREQ